MERKKPELIKRYALFLISLFVLAMGVALTKKSGLGVTPISSVANVLSLKFPALTLGNWMIVCNCVLIAGQVVLLRKNFKPIQLLQIPVSFLFGYFTDFGVWLLSPLNVEAYIPQLLFIVIGSAVVALGISLMVTADVIMNIGESFVKAVADISRWEFGNVKIGFDIACVLLAVLLSLIFFNFRIRGIREGTVIIALVTGIITKFFLRILRSPLEKRLTK